MPTPYKWTGSNTAFPISYSIDSLFIPSLEKKTTNNYFYCKEIQRGRASVLCESKANKKIIFTLEKKM